MLTGLDDKTAAITARLRQYTSIEELDETDKRKFFEILKLIGKSGAQGVFISDLRGKNGLGGRYLRAAAIWLKEKGWIKANRKDRHEQVCLTGKGYDALSVLERYCYSPLADPKLKIHFPLDTGQTIVTSISGKDVLPIEKLEILSQPRVREGIVKIAHGLIESNHKNITLDIEIPPLHASRLTSFIKLVELVYWLVLQKSGYRGLLAYEPISENAENQNVYTSFWKNYLEKHLSLKDNEVYQSSIWIFDGMPDGRKESFQQPLHDFFVKELEFPEQTFSRFTDYLSEPPIRKWIEDRLAKDPDWFMPHYFWKNPGYWAGYFLGFDLPSLTLKRLESLVDGLGFECGEIPPIGTFLVNTKGADQTTLDRVEAIIRENNGICIPVTNLGFRVEFVDQIKPPLWHEYSNAEITNEYFQLEFDLKCMADFGDSFLNPTIDYLLKKDLNSELFYRNWRVLYQVFSKQNKDKIAQSNKLRDLLGLIQRAYVKYILEGKPKIDLVAVLNNYKVTLDSSKLLQDIENGKYDIGVV